jgi:hypothetical protein
MGALVSSENRLSVPIPPAPNASIRRRLRAELVGRELPHEAFVVPRPGDQAILAVHDNPNPIHGKFLRPEDTKKSLRLHRHGENVGHLATCKHWHTNAQDGSS